MNQFIYFRFGQKTTIYLYYFSSFNRLYPESQPVCYQSRCGVATPDQAAHVHNILVLMNNMFVSKII